MPRWRQHLPFLALLGVFLFAFFRSLDVEILGHDYFYFFSKLLDGKWHFLRQGLRPFLYTAHFCGAFPEYGNPQSLYYSLPQLLTLFLDVWLAARLAMLFAMVVGYVGWYRFGRDIVRLSLQWSHVLSLIVIAHGFYFMHMVPGHIVFHGMPLLGWMLWCVFERSSNTSGVLLRRAGFFALLTAYAVYSGGYMIGIMGMFALLTLLPFDLLMHARSRSEFLIHLKFFTIRLSACTVAALLIIASKVIAVTSLMRALPRVLPFERFTEGSNALWYFLKASFAIPQGDVLFKDVGMPTWGAVHEYSLFLSPVVLVGLVSGIWLLWIHRAALRQRKSRLIIASAMVMILGIFFLQLARGYGVLVTPLESLPLMKSLHYNMRYLYAFSFLPILASVWCLEHVFHCRKRSHLYAWAAGLLTVLAFVLAYAPLVRGDAGLLARTLPYEVVVRGIRENPEFLQRPVTTIFDFRRMGHSEFVAIFFGGNDAFCQEPMLWGSGGFTKEELRGGRINESWDGGYNLYNPACIIYPKENNCSPGDRIAIGDEKNLTQFIQGLPTTWKVSTLQHIANYVSLLTFILCILFVIPWNRMRHMLEPPKK